ncbi:MAG: hypothetical protein AAF962_09160 [Actinomycetota bacterium]
MEGTTDGGSARLVTTIARPLVIIVGGVGMALLLRALAPEPTGSGQFLPWDRVWDRLLVSIELAVAGTLLALVVAVPFGLAARTSVTTERLLGAGAFLSSLLVPVVVQFTLLYWLSVRLGWFPVLGWTSLSDDVGDHVRSLVVPSLGIAIVMAMPLAVLVRDTMSPWRRRSLGLEALAPVLANRSGPTSVRLIGFPMGLLLIAVLLAEWTMRIPGVLALAVQSTQVFDLDATLAATIILIVAGAVGALIIDVVAIGVGDPDRRETAIASVSPGPTSSARSVVVLAVGGGMLAILSITAIAGRLAGLPDIDVNAIDSFWSDRLGRNRPRLFAFAIGPFLLRSFVVAAVATAVATGLTALAHSLGAGARYVLGLVVDLFWWPLIPMLLLGSAAFSVPGSFTPWLIIMLSLGLLPVATRLAHREHATGVNPLSAIGLLLLLMGWAAAIELAFGTFFARPESFAFFVVEGQREIGNELGWQILVALATMLVLAAIQLTGLGLLGLGRRSSSPVAVAPPPVGAMAAPAPGAGLAPAAQPPSFPPPTAPPPSEPPVAPPVASPSTAPPPSEPPVAPPVASPPASAPATGAQAPPPGSPPVQPPPVVGAPNRPGGETISVPPPVDPPTDAPVAPAPPEPPVRPSEGEGR